MTSLGFFSGCETATKPTTVETASLPPEPPLSPGDIHKGLTYPLDQVAEAKAVPPVFVSSLSVNLDRIADVDEKKATFFRIMLPHIARENDRIRAEREKSPRDLTRHRMPCSRNTKSSTATSQNC